MQLDASFCQVAAAKSKAEPVVAQKAVFLNASSRSSFENRVPLQVAVAKASFTKVAAVTLGKTFAVAGQELIPSPKTEWNL